MNTLFLYMLLLLVPTTKEKPQLTIQIQNIKVIKGAIKIGIFNTNKDFLGDNSAIRNYSIDVKSNSAKIVIDDLPTGDYAVSMYQDVNSDNICNRNFMGIPKEPYGFSNNFKPKFSAPKFEDCKFSLNKDQILTIKLIH